MVTRSARYRNRPPQLEGGMFLTDGGLETTLVFIDGADLPCFAALAMLDRAGGEERLRSYFQPYLETARAHGAGFVLETVTWRGSPDWGARIGWNAEKLAALNRRAVAFKAELREAWEQPGAPMPISACIGPRGDAYNPASLMSPQEAQDYHAWQVNLFAQTQADFVSAFTIAYPEEAIGVARAAAEAGMPCVISFTTETDGRLPSGTPLDEAIERVDAEAGTPPIYYMVNCAHTSHFGPALARGQAWTQRIRGLRANASSRSHAELDESTELDSGDPEDLGRSYAALLGAFRGINVVGGCCGTDHRHVAQAARFCAPVAA